MELHDEFVIAKQTVPVVKNCDVVVVGGGIAGISAAASAARNGMHVVLIEKSVVLGGLATSGNVCIYLALCDGCGNKVYGGLAEELLHETIRYGYDNLPDCWRGRPFRLEAPAGRYRTQFNVPAAIFAFDEMMEREGVEVVFDTVFSEPILEGRECKGVIVENKSGRTAYMAKMVVDASGDCDVFARAGADCVTAENLVSFWCHELNFDVMRKGISRGSMIDAIRIRWIGQNACSDNSGTELPTFTGCDSESRNEYIKLSRKLAREYLKAHQRADYAMLTMPFTPQFRTTRSIRSKVPFVPVPEKYEPNSVGCVVDSIKPHAPVYELPYEALLSGQFDNMIAAGRTVGGSKEAWELTRFIPACAFTGQVAGLAAALAVKRGKTLHDLEVGTLQDMLANSGIILHLTEAMRLENKTKRQYVNDALGDQNIVSESVILRESHH